MRGTRFITVALLTAGICFGVTTAVPADAA